MSLSGDGQSRRENKTSELKDRFTEIMQTEIKIGKKKKTTGKKKRATNTCSTILYGIRSQIEKNEWSRKEKKKWRHNGWKHSKTN